MEGTGRRYQLAHDVLVEPVRQWMALKQNETWQGRATLRMKELSTRWNARKESRNLPTFTEFLQIAGGVPKRRRNSDEQAMMASATSYFALRIAAAVAAVGILFAGYRYFDNQNQEKVVSGRIARLESTPVGGIPATIELLASDNRPLVSRLIRSRMAEVKDTETSLRFNLALAQIGEPTDIPVEAIVAAVVDADDGYSLPVIEALARTTGGLRKQALDALREELAEAEEPEIRARLATTLFYLGDLESLESFLAFGPLPGDRTAFVHSLEQWSADINPFLEIVEKAAATPNEFKSSTLYSVMLALCVRETELSGDQALRLEESLSGLAVNANIAPPVISACLALMNGLGTNEPELPRISSDDIMRLRVGSEMLSLYRVNAGEISLDRDSILPEQLNAPASNGEDLPPLPDRILSNEQAFLISDKPVSAGLFLEFINDPETVERLKEAGVEDTSTLYNSMYFERQLRAADDAADGITWYAALEFCNWLSRKAGREPYYRAKYQKLDLGNQVTCLTLERGGNGFRLPTCDQFEFAARGETRTAYFFGHADSDELLDYYGQYALTSGQTFKTGTTLPNPFGLFCMNGFADQWCDDPMGAMGMADFFGSNVYGEGHSSSRDKRFVNTNPTIRVCFRVLLPVD